MLHICRRPQQSPFDGLKPRWKVKKDDSVLVNGQAFVRVAPSNVGLCNLVAAKNELIPTTVKESSTPLLSFSKGLASLINLRNQKQAACLSEEGAECSLFERPKKKARARTPRQQLEAMRHTPEKHLLRH